MKYAVGIDVGGTNTRVALINEQYEIKERVQFGSDPKDPMKTLNQINDVIKEFGQEIEGIGISCPGPLDLINGVILTPPNQIISTVLEKYMKIRSQISHSRI